MRFFAQLVAVVLFVIAALLAFGWIGNADLGRSVGLVAVGLACWCAATMSAPPVAPRVNQ